MRTGDDVVIGDTVFEFEPAVEDLPADEREALLADDQVDEELAEDDL